MILLALQHFVRYLHASDRSRTFRRAVPVGAATRREAEMLDQCAEPTDLVGRVTRMAYLETIEA
jgi:hypothetical protein